VELATDGTRKQQLKQLYDKTLEECTEILPIDSRVAERFALVFSQLRRAGHPVETNDMWVAAIALVHDLTVVSNDAHFCFIHGLKVADWSKPETGGR